MAPAFKFAFQKCRHYRQGKFFPDYPCPKAEDIGIVVAAAHPRRKLIRAKGSPDGRIAVGGNAHAYARAANQDAEIAVCGDGLAKIPGYQWIIAAFRRVCAVILHFVAKLCQFASQKAFELETRMVRTDMNDRHTVLILLWFILG